MVEGAQGRTKSHPGSKQVHKWGIDLQIKDNKFWQPRFLSFRQETAQKGNTISTIIIFLRQASLCNSGFSTTHCVVQPGFKLHAVLLTQALERQDDRYISFIFWWYRLQFYLRTYFHMDNIFYSYLSKQGMYMIGHGILRIMASFYDGWECL